MEGKRCHYRLVFLLFAAVGAQAEASDLPLWPLPEGFASRPVAEEMRLNGVPMRVAFIQGVAREEDFRRDMDRSCRRESGEFQQLSLGFGKELWSCIRKPYSQTVQWHRVGAKIVGDSSVLNWQLRGPKPPPILPIPGQTQILSDLETKDGSLRGRVELLESHLSAAQMRAYFLGKARALGWAIVGVLSGKENRLALQKKGESLDLAFHPQPMGGSQAVLVWQQH